MSLLPLLFSFQGRINRAKYWYVTLIYVAILVVCLIVTVIGLLVLGASPSGGAVVSYVMKATLILFGLLAMWSSIATGVKRLHDRDQSGWWMLVFYAIGTAVSLLQETAIAPDSKVILNIASFAVTVWIIIEVGCLRGTQGPNRFGPDPLEAPTR